MPAFDMTPQSSWSNFKYKKTLGIICALLVASVGTYLLLATRADTVYETLTIKDTNYAIPAGAKFVAPGGNDNNSGTEASPYRTLTKAVSATTSGGTIVLRQGTYREAVPRFSKKLTIQPYPHEEAWLKGSTVVTGWTTDNGRWRKDNWTTQLCQTCHKEGALDPAYPHAGRPDMVFVGGSPLTQVGSLNDVAPGKFFADYPNAKLYIGSDPNGKEVEVTVHSVGLDFVADGAKGTTVRGLGIAHYASLDDASSGKAAAVIANTPEAVLENNTFAWNAARGLVLFTSSPVVRGNIFVYNGLSGLSSNLAHGALLESNRFAFNNVEHFVMAGAAAEAAGAKMARSHNVTARGNVFENNYATGYWLDVSTLNTITSRNVARYNGHHGLVIEISAQGLLASNVVTHSKDAGILVNNSSNIRLYNNTLANNNTNIKVVDDSRVNSNSTEVAQGITYITSNVVLINNILSQNDGSGGAYLYVRDYNSSPIKTAAQMVGGINYNAYYRANSSVPLNLVEWWTSVTNRQLYTSLATFRTATGKEANGVAIDNQPTNPFFIDEARGDYALKSDSPAKGTGQALPIDTAGVLSVPTSPIDRGALLLSTTPIDRIPPTAPSELTSSIIRGHQVVLSWKAGTDDSSAVIYDVYRNGSVVATTNTTTHTDGDVPPHQSYTYKIVAKDAAGNVSEPSNEITRTRK